METAGTESGDELDVPDALCDWLDEFCEPFERELRVYKHESVSTGDVRPARVDVEVAAGADGWETLAAASLRDSGFCVLRGPLLVPAAAAAGCREYASSRLSKLMSLARDRGDDPRADRFTYGEVCSRTPGGRRLDMRLPHRLWERDDCPTAWGCLLASVDRWVRPVLEASGLSTAGPSGVRVDSAGCVTALPGAPLQHFHPDGTVQGLVNVFVPLVRVDAANGSTELRPGTHEWLHDAMGAREDWDERRGDVAAAPCLDPGELLLFDYRVMHRGRANATVEDRPVAYVVYACRPGIGDVHNFPSNSWLCETSRAELEGE